MNVDSWQLNCPSITLHYHLSYYLWVCDDTVLNNLQLASKPYNKSKALASQTLLTGFQWTGRPNCGQSCVKVIPSVFTWISSCPGMLLIAKRDHQVFCESPKTVGKSLIRHTHRMSTSASMKWCVQCMRSPCLNSTTIKKSLERAMREINILHFVFVMCVELVL